MDWTGQGVKAYHILRSRLGSRYGCMSFEDLYQEFKKRDAREENEEHEPYLGGGEEKLAYECNHAYSKSLDDTGIFKHPHKHCCDCGEKL